MAELALPMNENSWISAVDTLAKLHKVDYKTVGLEGYGKPAGFYRRQIGSLSKVSAAQAAAKDKDGVEVGAIQGMEELTAWFKSHEVADSTSIVHGDYKVSKTEWSFPLFSVLESFFSYYCGLIIFLLDLLSSRWTTWSSTQRSPV